MRVLRDGLLIWRRVSRLAIGTGITSDYKRQQYEHQDFRRVQHSLVDPANGRSMQIVTPSHTAFGYRPIDALSDKWIPGTELSRGGPNRNVARGHRLTIHLHSSRTHHFSDDVGPPDGACAKDRQRFR